MSSLERHAWLSAKRFWMPGSTTSLSGRRGSRPLSAPKTMIGRSSCSNPPKNLEDKHKSALDALIADSAAQLKRLISDLAAASAAMVDLDW